MVAPTGTCRSWPCRHCGADGMGVRRDNESGGWRCKACGHFERDEPKPITSIVFLICFVAAATLILYLIERSFPR